ncbi:hypothetical protein PGT21_011354 [Puccinia graminis f. sp. tritici]|uniref:superoxide dismutase n=1 Tax=Puccinia graminis f. sp. tritici TaxID=56615 RepID=A0A5B0NKX5_PUCGR|nr:hypothetical protein PGT21_011354 [Puccinia graminis f. sp. tritici]KAA1128750.1 hypothetical protein PGTUg99_011606 [Puccinia graminis f. sp. tritici]
MQLSFISGLVCLSLLKSSEAAPQLSLAQAASHLARPTNARATLMSPTGAPIYGLVEFRATATMDVQVQVTVFGLDHSLPHGEHAYHIHANPVGADGNCEATGGHLNPTGIADSVTCNPMVPKTCKEGDLSGKHGVLAGAQRSIQLSYTDPNLQFSSPESGIIGRGLVIHDSKGARIACGNIIRGN